MKLEIQLPFKVQVRDYHEFDGIQDLLNAIGNLRVKFVERSDDEGAYTAVFYSGARPDKKTLKSLPIIYY